MGTSKWKALKRSEAGRELGGVYLAGDPVALAKVFAKWAGENADHSRSSWALWTASCWASMKCRLC